MVLDSGVIAEMDRPQTLLEQPAGMFKHLWDTKNEQ